MKHLHSSNIALACLIVAITVSRATAATFEGLGFLDANNKPTYTYGVSADGNVVVGKYGSWSSRGGGSQEAFSWEDGTITGLGDLAQNGLRSCAYGASADGDIVVGVGNNWDGDHAVKWQGGITLLGALTGEETAESWAYDASADGNVIVGASINMDSDIQAFRWAHGTMTGLAFLDANYPASDARGVSSDGNVVVGYSGKFGGVAVMWKDGNVINLGYLPGGVISWANAVSADGNVVVGTADQGDGVPPWTAFRWTEDGNMQGVGVDPNTHMSEAFDVSGDGSIVVGYRLGMGDYEAFIWDVDNGLRDVKDVLKDDYDLTDDVNDWDLRYATGISDDGTVIVGYGTDPNGDTQAWIAHCADASLDVNDVRIYADSNYETALTDAQVHFGHRDGDSNDAIPNMYIEVGATGGNSRTVDTAHLTVSSEADTTGISVLFKETGAATNIYKVVAPIHLAADSNQANLELQVDDEENLKVAGASGNAYGVKVDRGELAIITLDDAWAESPADRIYGIFDKDANMPPIYNWWSVGDNREESNGTIFATFVKSVGESNLQCPGDLMFSGSHGNYGHLSSSTAYMLYKPNDVHTPTIDANDWNKDIEWAILHACNVLGQYDPNDPNAWDPDAHVPDWDDALLRGANENNCHGILGSSRTISYGRADHHMIFFLVHVITTETFGAPDKVIDAWMDGADMAGQWGAAALFHYDNKNDYVNDVTPDTNDANMYYTWFGLPPDSNQYDSNDELSIDGQVGVTADVVGTDITGASVKEKLRGLGGETGARIACEVPHTRPALTRVRVRKEAVGRGAYDAGGFDRQLANTTGGVSFMKSSRNPDRHDGPIRINSSQARIKAAGFVRQRGGGMPADAFLGATRNQMVATYNATDPESTREEYVRKVILEYHHSVDGIQIAGGPRGDVISVGIEGSNVVSFRRHWRSVIGPVGPTRQVVSAEDALKVAAAEIPRRIPGGPMPYSITEIKLFYQGLPSEQEVQELTPAWGFLVDRTLWFYVDAFTGEFLD